MGLPGIAINLSAWENTGLAKDLRVTEGLKQKSIGSIEPKQGIEILEQLLIYDPAQVGVIPIDWDIWQQHNPVTPYYEDLIAVKDLKEVTVSNSREEQQLLTAILEQREALIIEQITQQVENILGIKDLNSIDFELGFSELGLDSLSSVELRKKNQSSYDVKLSKTVMFDYSNVRQLGIYLLSLMFDRNISKQNNNTDVQLDTLANLSEEDAERALLAELENINY